MAGRCLAFRVVGQWVPGSVQDEMDLEGHLNGYETDLRSPIRLLRRDRNVPGVDALDFVHSRPRSKPADSRRVEHLRTRELEPRPDRDAQIRLECVQMKFLKCRRRHEFPYAV